MVTHLVLLLQELAEALVRLELPMYFMPKVNLLKSLFQDYEDVVDTAEKIFHLSRNYIAITPTVAKLAKIDFNATMTNILKDFGTIWKSVKKTKSSEVKDQSKIHMHQHHFREQEGCQDGLDSISNELLYIVRTFLDFLMQS